MPDVNPFAPPTLPAPAHEAVFGSRYPSLLLGMGDNRMISFRHGEYRTTDPAEIAFLLRVVADESRANKGVWVRQLPPAEPALATPPAASAPRSASPRKSKRGS